MVISTKLVSFSMLKPLLVYYSLFLGRTFVTVISITVLVSFSMLKPLLVYY